MSHYHVLKLQEPEPGKVAFYREDEIHLSRAAPDDIVRVCYAATPPTDARPNWTALCRELNEKGKVSEHTISALPPALAQQGPVVSPDSGSATRRTSFWPALEGRRWQRLRTTRPRG